MNWKNSAETYKFLDETKLRWFLSDLLNCPLTMIPWQEHPTQAQREAFETAMQRLAAGEPVQYICGRAPFLDFEVRVSPDVLIPRPETEQLVELCCQAPLPEAPVILDVGTGSGCIAIALKRRFPAANVHAVDLSGAALNLARENARTLGADISFRQADLLADTPAASVDLIVANLPYIGLTEAAALPKEVRDFEPHLALFAGADGTDLVCRLMDQARSVLKPGGRIFLETGETQQQCYRETAAALGWDIRAFRDLAGRERFWELRFSAP